MDRFYTGETSNLELRLHFHEDPEARKFTAKANDWELYLEIKCESKKQALSIEKHIKKMKSKTYIQNLLRYPEIIKKLKKRFVP